MKKWKQLLALLLAMAMCLMLLAACAKQDDAEEAPSDAEQSGDTQDEETPDDAETSDDSEDEEPGEITEITMACFDPMANGERADHVEVAINELTESKIGVHVDIEWWDIGSWSTQINLAASSGDLPDIIGAFAVVSLSSMISDGKLLDMSPYLGEECAAGVMSVVGDYLDATTVDGAVYAFPTYRIYATDQYIIMRQDILDELGMTEQAQNMTTWGEFEEILYAVKENYNDIYAMSKSSGYNVLNFDVVMYPNILEGGAFADAVTYDKISDTIGYTYTDEDGNVSLNVDQPAYKDMCEKIAQWYNDGILYADAPFSKDHADVLMSTGVVFASQQASEIGIESAKESATGYEVVCVPIAKGEITTSTLNQWACGLSAHCDEPEAALEFISLAYTDPELMTLMNWGVEGEDYVMNDAGEADYPEGKDSSSVYHYGDWIFGNQFLVEPWAGQGGDFRETSLAANEEVESSPYLGFAFDSTGLDTMMASITSVYNEYYQTINSGLYTEDLLEEYRSKLTDAGIDDYIAEMQAQLTEWLNNQ